MTVELLARAISQTRLHFYLCRRRKFIQTAESLVRRLQSNYLRMDPPDEDDQMRQMMGFAAFGGKKPKHKPKREGASGKS